ncbi:MAG: abortive infection protein [Candidatus Bathyarchaeia archaeon]
MRVKGVSYDVGRVMGMNWRPHFDPKTVHRELEIIKNDLHCNTVRICGLNINRLMTASEAALDVGLEVWLSPEMWDKSAAKTLRYITKAAVAAETLRQRYPERLVFSVGSELTLFMQGIVKGRNFTARIKNPALIPRIKAGEHNKPLNEFLAKANTSVREVFHGKVTYASLVWEAVDWGLFDFVGVDHYRIARIEDKYVEMLKPSFSHNKPVVITEFGYGTCQGGIGSEGFLSSSGLGGGIIDVKSQFLHQIPVLGRFVRPHTKGIHVREEQWQARKLVENLSVLDNAGVDGAFIFQFMSQITPYSDNPKYDLDMASSSLVKYYDDGKHGATYPNMAWEPKESFKAVADYYRLG